MFGYKRGTGLQTEKENMQSDKEVRSRDLGLRLRGGEGRVSSQNGPEFRGGGTIGLSVRVCKVTITLAFLVCFKMRMRDHVFEAPGI